MQPFFENAHFSFAGYLVSWWRLIFSENTVYFLIVNVTRDDQRSHVTHDNRWNHVTVSPGYIRTMQFFSISGCLILCSAHKHLLRSTFITDTFVSWRDYKSQKCWVPVPLTNDVTRARYITSSSSPISVLDTQTNLGWQARQPCWDSCQSTREQRTALSFRSECTVALSLADSRNKHTTACIVLNIHDIIRRLKTTCEMPRLVD